jgi:hypothetical protein
MDISGVNNGIAASTMIQMKKAIDLDLQEALTKANADSGNPLGTSIDFSKPSELLSKLEQLKNENPDKFKELMKEISDALKEDAADSGLDASTSAFLSMLSEKFANVAETGDLSQLQPPPPPPPNNGNCAAAARYDSNSGSQESLLEALLLQARIDGSALTSTGSSTTNSGTDASATLSKVQKLLAEALQLLGVNNG